MQYIFKKIEGYIFKQKYSKIGIVKVIFGVKYSSKNSCFNEKMKKKKNQNKNGKKVIIICFRQKLYDSFKNPVG